MTSRTVYLLGFALSPDRERYGRAIIHTSDVAKRMMRTIAGTLTGAALTVALLTACSSFHDSHQPQKVTGTTIEQVMGITPKPVRVTADRRVAAREPSRPESAPAAAAPAAARLKAVAPKAPKPESRTSAAAAPRMPASPVEKVVAAPLPNDRPSGQIRIFLQSRDPETGNRTFAIASDSVSEEDMIQVVPYLPALFAEGTRMTGFAYLNGTIVLAEHCPDDPAAGGPGCPSYLSTIEVFPNFGAGGRDDFIPVSAALDVLRDFDRKMKRRLGTFGFIVCGEPLDRCSAPG